MAACVVVRQQARQELLQLPPVYNAVVAEELVMDDAAKSRLARPARRGCYLVHRQGIALIPWHRGLGAYQNDL